MYNGLFCFPTTATQRITMAFASCQSSQCKQARQSQAHRQQRKLDADRDEKGIKLVCFRFFLMAAEDGFVPVQRRRRKRERKGHGHHQGHQKQRGMSQSHPYHGLQNGDDDDAPITDKAVQTTLDRLLRCKAEVEASDFLRDLKGLLEQHQLQINRIVCLGVGNFSSETNARLQLALLLCLEDVVFGSTRPRQPTLHNTLDTSATTVPLSDIAQPQTDSALDDHSETRKRPALCVFDPALSRLERAVLQRFSWDVPTSNDHGWRPVAAEPNSTATLFFMPHCPLPLYNNVLAANWHPQTLPCVAILGNSFAHYKERKLDRELTVQAPALAHALAVPDLIHEATPTNDIVPEAAFNDTALHVFSTTVASKVDSQVWQDPGATTAVEPQGELV
eukprot:m.479904 g.479904  ORF g.479904 m.479904 type:complete len:391 (+) comp21629_c0_seq1:383-1555(+)